jgi:AcrR family transcriptional regulator
LLRSKVVKQYKPRTINHWHNNRPATGHAEQLTIANLSAESGVTPASIYDYFPSIEALIAATLDDVLRITLEKLLEHVESLPTNTPLTNVISKIVAETVASRNELFEMAPELYLKYADYYEVRDDVTLYDYNQHDSFTITKMLLARFQDQISAQDFDYSVYLFVRGLQLLTRSILQERTKQATSPHTVRLLTSMLSAVFQEEGETARVREQ